MSKDAWLELNIQRYVVEEREFDLLSMGRPEGSGCYCYANNLVRGCIDDLQRSYEYVVMDNEAGLEHLSRRTTRDVDLLLIVVGPERARHPHRRHAEPARRRAQDRRRRALPAGQPRRSSRSTPRCIAATEATGVPLLGVVPGDDGVTHADLDRRRPVRPARRLRGARGGAHAARRGRTRAARRPS